jgi:hypothetical protein
MGGKGHMSLTACTLLLLMTSSAFAGIPDPALSTVPNVIYEPSGSTEYKVIVVGSSGPIDNALVRIVFSDEADTLVCWCVSQDHPVIEATTNINGEASFFIGAGGCLEPAQLSTPPVTVYADGVLLAQVGAVSADVGDDSGRLPHEGWNPGATCGVSLSDAIYFTDPITTGTYDFCSDLDSNGAVDVTDAVIITPPITLGYFCTAQ